MARNWPVTPEQKAKRKEYNRNWYLVHQEHMRECRKAWRLANPEADKRGKQKYAATAKGKLAHKKAQNNLRKKWKPLAFERLGGKCNRCGFTDYRALQIDHINGDNRANGRPENWHPSFYKRVFDDMEGRYQLLCANCNWIKRAENGEAPHGLLGSAEEGVGCLMKPSIN